MRILLLGEYSNLHATLARGLRKLGHEVCVASGGDFWKDYPRDIDISRKNLSKTEGIRCYLNILKNLPRFRNYDIVQLINPVFFDVKAARLLPVYNYLKRNNGKVFLGAFGVDTFWINTCLDGKTFRYSDFDLFGKRRDNYYNQGEIDTWIGSDNEKLNREIAASCDGVIACLYEYFAPYHNIYPGKTFFAPLPVDDIHIKETDKKPSDKVRFFIGINKSRSIVKGTDIMERALDRLKENYPDRCEIMKAVSVPFEEYVRMFESSDVILDQIYSYTPAMNALHAMAKGIVAVSGGEPENYEIIDEKELRPIINVLPDEEDIYKKLEWIVMNREKLPHLSKESREYVEKHHHYLKVAQRYLDIWSGKAGDQSEQ